MMDRQRRISSPNLSSLLYGMVRLGSWLGTAVRSFVKPQTVTLCEDGPVSL